MATTYTWTYTYSSQPTDGSYTIENNLVEVKASGASVTITPPARSIGLSPRGVTSKVKYYVQKHRLDYTKADGTSAHLNFSDEFTSTSVNVGTKVSIPSSSVTLQTADLFSALNPTTPYIDCLIKFPYAGNLIGTTVIISQYDEPAGGPPSQLTVGTMRVALDVPPTATVPAAVSFDTNFVYAGLTTASVMISDAAAYYGGSVTDVTLKIGTQTDSISGNGTLYIPLDTAGSFIPVVTVTDSRGQTKDYPLAEITVQTYAPPTVDFTADRTDSAGTPDDEGTYALCPATFTFDDVIGEAYAPSVVLTDENGTQTTPAVTWYTDGTLATTVTWSSLSSGDTVYGLIPGLNTNYSYQISIRPRDQVDGTVNTGTAIIQTVSSAFYTVDFLAGGHGIAFGQPASQEGFYCNMDANFVDANDVMRALFDFIHPVGSYYETSDTSFDPNVTWGGTWSLETEGQVHISAGANYTVSGALTDTTDGGASTVTLNTTQIPSHSHRPYNGSAYAFVETDTGATITRASTAGSSNANFVRSSASFYRHDTTNSVGGGQAHNNMQPYIIVNRWHRTA